MRSNFGSAATPYQNLSYLQRFARATTTQFVDTSEPSINIYIYTYWRLSLRALHDGSAR